MFWSRGSSRQRRAVLSALSAVGDTGMSLLALGVAVNLPEGRLHAILDGLIRSGQVRRRGTPSSVIPGPRTANYHLAAARHSALPPRLAARRPTVDRPKPGDERMPAGRRPDVGGRPSPGPLSPRIGAVASTSLRPSRTPRS
jgi:hypothetical protein